MLRDEGGVRARTRGEDHTTKSTKGPRVKKLKSQNLKRQGARGGVGDWRLEIGDWGLGIGDWAGPIATRSQKADGVERAEYGVQIPSLRFQI